MKLNCKNYLQKRIFFVMLALVLLVGCFLLPVNSKNKSITEESLEVNLAKYAITNQNANSFQAFGVNEQVSQIIAKSGLEYNYQITDYLPSAYEVELITPNGNIFIEGSYDSNSIFYNSDFEEYYYGGVGQYFGKRNGIWKNLLTNEILESSPKMIMDFNFDDLSSERENQSVLTNMSTTVSGFKVINNHNYFRNLKNFPNHVDINKVYPGVMDSSIQPGTCGVVAVSMLLGYYQNNTTWNIIPELEYRSGNGTNDAFAEYLFRSWIWNGKSGIAEGTIMGTYDIVSSSNAGFPMASVENKVLIEKYTKSNEQKYKHNASAWFPKTNVEKYINSDTPSIGTTTAYSMSGGDKKKSMHNVIIYGYSSGKYLCHMGWRPGSTAYTQTVLSELALHSYYTISK